MEYVPAFPINSAAHEKLLDVIKVSICADLVKLQTLVRSCRSEQDLQFLQQFSLGLQKCATQLETGVAEAGEVIPSPHNPEPATVNRDPPQDNNPEVARFLSEMEFSLKDSAASWSRKRSFVEYSADLNRTGYSYRQQKHHEHVEKNDVSYQVARQTVPRGPRSIAYQTETETRKKPRTSTTVSNKRSGEKDPLNALYRLLECTGAELIFQDAVPDWDEHRRELCTVRCYYQNPDVPRLLIGCGTGSSRGGAKRAAAQNALANEVLMKDLSAFKKQNANQRIVTTRQTSEPSQRIIESYKPSIASQSKPLVKPIFASQPKPLVNGINTERRALSCLDGKDCANRATCFFRHESDSNATAKATSPLGMVEAMHHNAAVPAVNLLCTNEPKSPPAVIKLE